MIVKVNTVCKYNFVFDSSDRIKVDKKERALSDGWATFLLDDEQRSLFVQSDYGSYSYRWGSSCDCESFASLLSRVSDEYLLGKLSDKSEVNWKKTKQKAARCFFTQGRDRTASNARAFLSGLKTIEDGDERALYHFLSVYMDDVWDMDIIDKDYPMQAKMIVSIFMKYCVPELGR